MKQNVLEIFINKSIILHNNKYDYSLVNYVNSYTKVKIICIKHSEFKQLPNDHIHNKQGCSKCNISKGEDKIKNLLNKYNINFEEQKKFQNCKNIKELPFDFYLPNYNICIEFDGEQHFKENHYFNKKIVMKIKKRDNIKTNYCIDNKIKLIRLNSLDNIENKIIKTIK